MELLKGPVVVKPGDTFDHWHQVTCRNFSLTESNRISNKQFCARISLRKFGRLGFSEIWSATSADDFIRVSRGDADIRRDQRDYFALWLALAGRTTFAQGGREAHLGPGDLMLHDQTQPFTLEFGRTSHAVTMSIPRPLLISRLPTASQLTARRVCSGTTLGAFAGSVVRDLVKLEDCANEGTVARLSASALDLVVTALENELTGYGGPTPLSDRRLAQVKRYILANLDDPELDLETIAQRQNMGARTLNRLFAREGTTPIRWLWRQRLAAAYQALADKRIDRVTEAAFSFGFSDVAHFSRAFKAAFRESPEAVLRH